MNLSAHALRLEISALHCANVEDWSRVQVEVQALRFTGTFEADLQRGDLERFVEELDAMYVAVGQQATATLCSAEPNIYVRLNMQRLGGITGEYKFMIDGDAGGISTLAGSFEIDQTYLLALCGSARTLVAELGGANAA
jgi:hypothetical protein